MQNQPVPQNKIIAWVKRLSWNKIITWLKRLGWVGFFLFLIKGVTLYIVLPYLIAKGVISCDVK